MPSGAERRLYWGTALAVIAFDLITKFLAEKFLVASVGRQVLGQWLQLRLVYNPGAAFGLDVGPYSRWIFMLVAIVAVVALYRMSRNALPGDWFRQLSLGLVSWRCCSAIWWTGCATRRAWWTSSTSVSAHTAGQPSTWPTWP